MAHESRNSDDIDPVGWECEWVGSLDLDLMYLDRTGWRPGVDYVAAWREAREVGEDLADALHASSVRGWCVVPWVLEDGSSGVDLRLTSAAAAAFAAMVRENVRRRWRSGLEGGSGGTLRSAVCRP